MPHIPRKQPARAYLTKRTRESSESDEGAKFLQSARWKKARQKILGQSPLCEVCVAAGRIPIPPADVVDHIVPRIKSGALLDPRNLMPMCHTCHNRKSGMEAHDGVLVEARETRRGGLIPQNRKEIINILCAY